MGQVNALDESGTRRPRVTRDDPVRNSEGSEADIRAQRPRAARDERDSCSRTPTMPGGAGTPRGRSAAARGETLGRDDRSRTDNWDPTVAALLSFAPERGSLRSRSQLEHEATQCGRGRALKMISGSSVVSNPCSRDFDEGRARTRTLKSTQGCAGQGVGVPKKGHASQVVPSSPRVSGSNRRIGD